MDSISVGEVLAAKLLSELYTALMECRPTVRALVANEAVPLASDALPINVPPSKNCTVPDADAGETLAVKVTV